MITNQALDTMSTLISELKDALHKAESSYKCLEHTRNQMFMYNNSLTKLRQESVNRVFTTKHIIVYTYNRKLIFSCIYLATIFGIYITRLIYTPTLWTFWGLIAISELILRSTSI